MPPRISDLGNFLVGYADLGDVPERERQVDLGHGGFPLPTEGELRNVVRTWLAWSKAAVGHAAAGVVTRSLAALADYVIFVETARRRNEKRLGAKMKLWIRDMEKRGREVAS